MQITSCSQLIIGRYEFHFDVAALKENGKEKSSNSFVIME